MKKSLLVTLLCCFYPFVLFSALPYKHFKHLTINEGLTRNAIYTLLQDKQGFMWFGGWDGLYRYDGVELRLMCHRPVSGDLNEQVIYKIIEDGVGHIWMGTSSGLALWDMVRECTIPFTAKTPQGDSIKSSISSLLRDNNGRIWVGQTNGQLFIYDEHTKGLKQLSKQFKHPLSNITRIYEDKAQNIWITTASNGVFRCKKSKISDITFAQDSLLSSISEEGQCIFQDSEDAYWFGTSKALYRITNMFGSPTIEQIAGSGSFTGNPLSVKAIAEDNRQVYITTNRGLLTYSLPNKEITILKPNYTSENSLNDQNLHDIYVDREKGLWISTFYGGVNYSSPTFGNFLSYQSLNTQIDGHVVSSIAEDQQGNIWMGIEDGGVCHWDRTTNVLTNYNSRTTARFRPTDDNVQAIFLDGRFLYIGMYNGGMDIVDLQNEKVRNYRKDSFGPGSFSNHVYAFKKDREGKIWIGTLHGLFLYNPQQRTLFPVKAITGTKVNCIVNDQEGNILISTLSKGIFCYHTPTNTWKQFQHRENDSTSIPCNSITTLSAQSGTVYVGTQGAGLWRYDKKHDRFTSIAPYVLGDKYIFKILPEKQSLWITTNKGLFHYNLQKKSIKHFTSEDGLRSEQFKVNSGIQTTDGLFILGGVNGFNAFYSSDLRSNPIAPPAVFTRLYLLNNPVYPNAQGSPLKQAVNYTRSLQLKQEHLQFAIQFASLSFCDTHKNKYEYMLEPFETTWQRANEAHLATYTNLPAGDYKFRIRTSNGDGIWSKEETMNITIEPYWWLSRPMKTGYVLLLISTLLLILRYYRQKQHAAFEMLKIKKEQEIYHAKTEFFTCIVHELRTPLTLIVGPLSKLMKQKGSFEEALPDLQLIERNGQRLLSLVNQLMDFRKIENKSYTIQPTAIDLCTLIRRVGNDFTYQSSLHDLQFNLHLPSSPCYAMIDNEAFTKVLSNLFSNAIKFTDSRVDITLFSSTETAVWNISVQDNGCGIAVEDQKRIFDSFYQARSDSGRNPNGTGIGLFLVRKLLLLQGGDISVKSQPNQGACFTVRIPACPPPCTVQVVAEEEDTPTNTPLMNQQAQRESSDPKRHLLIAEDHDDMRQYICSVLQDTYNITACSNGKNALTALTNTTYDLILTDWMMPEMDGLELCRHLRSQLATCHIPIIMLTAKEDEDSQVQGFEQGADLYIIKPFSAELLTAQIRALIRNRDRMSSRFINEPDIKAAALCRNKLDQQFMEKLDQCIEQQLADGNLTIDDLANKMALGRSLFFQKVKGISGLTPNDYLRTYRLKKAALLFKQGERRINEVGYQVGFSSPSYFSKRFSAHFGISPSDYLKSIEQNSQSEE